MFGNTFGNMFTVTTFGESHGPALGCVIDGCPAGVPLSLAEIQAALDRRRPGNKAQNPAVTARSEPDAVEVLSGFFEGRTTGTPLALLIRNTSQHSADYGNLKDTFRPGHADYTYHAKYDGNRDYRGGGRSSGRETAARVAAGDVARQVLATFANAACAKQTGADATRATTSPGTAPDLGAAPVTVTAYTVEAAGIIAQKRDFSAIEQNPLRAPDLEAAQAMQEKVAELSRNGDSAGGIVECVIQNVPPGLGEPVFGKLDAELAKAMLGIGAVKGIEFGSGFESARMNGSTWNDGMKSDGRGGFDWLSNHAGGILGGISNGNDIVFRVAVKPVPSIYQKQETVNTTYEDVELEIQGRHDVCLCPRIIPVIEAMAYLVLCDMTLIQRGKSLA